jgi:hypothetical protein
MEDAKAAGRHLLRLPGSSAASPVLVSGQAREVILRPLDPGTPAMAAWLEEAGAPPERRRRVYDKLSGERSLNIDGELNGWAPVRLRVLMRSVRVLA